CSMILKITPEVFYPQPKVHSAILRLKTKNSKELLKNYNFFEEIVKQIFAQRRKTIHNNLKSILKERKIDPSTLPVDT
ncbi:16S rRNA (adenine(1518)-N(6)/adenine(1519)-N(6))-dimethyltransferase, partial [Francisella tularensis subsp. holarctica]|uniref:rRNA adenine N-6-methyltransferase family protein n=1 Tax=Francisella tularensis TaxID=263 RepID=UPI002381A9A9